MKTQKFITEATWSGDEKSINVIISDVHNTGSYNIPVKGTDKTYKIEVGSENWEDENIEECQRIILNSLSDYDIVNKDFDIE